MAKPARTASDLGQRVEDAGGSQTPISQSVIAAMRSGAQAVGRTARAAGKLISDTGRVLASALPAPAPATTDPNVLNSGFGAQDWMGVGVPIKPTELTGMSGGRQFDFAPGQNLRYIPRSGEFPFQVMRALSRNSDGMRRAIEKRKGRIARMPFTVKAIAMPGEADYEKVAREKKDPRIQAIMDFLVEPDRGVTWDQWTRNVLEQIIVTDALTINPVRTRSGGLDRLEIWDGATMSLVLDERGRTPEPPLPAYRQVIKGTVASWYTSEELIYWRSNQSADRVYGYSVIEQAMNYINISIRRQSKQLFEYTIGNTPVGFFIAPPNWNETQWNDFRLYWESMASLRKRSQMQVIPAGVDVKFPQEVAEKNEFDEWLMRIFCDALGLSASPFIRQVNRATAQSSADSADEDGDDAWADTYCSLWNSIFRHILGITDLELSLSRRAEVDQLKQAQTHEIYLARGVISINEAREDLGRPPIPDGNDPIIYGAAVGGVLTDVVEQSALATEQKKNPPTPALPPGAPGPKGLPGGGAPPKQITAGDEPPAQKKSLDSDSSRSQSYDPDELGVLIVDDVPVGVVTRAQFLKYSPDQPRDDDGRWSLEGGGPGGQTWQRLAQEARQEVLAAHPKYAHTGLASNLNSLMANAKNFQDSRTWYRDAHETIREVIGPQDANLFEQILAGTSLHTLVEANVTVAVKAYEFYKEHGTFDGFKGLPAHLGELKRIEAGLGVHGPKAENFNANLHGDYSKVTVDFRMGQIIFGKNLSESGSISMGHHAIVQNVVTRFAQKMGWTPAEMQAVMWAANRVGSGTNFRMPNFKDALLERAEAIRIWRKSAHVRKSIGPDGEPSGPDLEQAYRHAAMLVGFLMKLREQVGPGATDQAVQDFMDQTFKYSPDQLRDDAGRFAYEGGEGGAQNQNPGEKDLSRDAYSLRRAGGARQLANLALARYSRDPREREILNQMSDRELLAIEDYSLGDLNRMNRDLGEDPAHVSATEASIARDLYGAMQKMPQVEDEMYRGIAFGKPEDLARYTPGATVVDTGFTSVSRSRDVALDYATGRASWDDVGVGGPTAAMQVHPPQYGAIFHYPAGDKTAYMGAFGQMVVTRDDQEGLKYPGGKYRIKSVTPAPGRPTEIELDAIP